MYSHAIALLVLISFLPGTAVLLAADNELDLEPYRGKVVYVDFWASWCVPCRASFPWMNALKAELGAEGFVVVGVNTGDSPEQAARFLERVPADFDIIYDIDGEIASAHALKGMPMAYVYDRDGILVTSHIGFNKRSGAKRADEIRKLVRQ